MCCRKGAELSAMTVNHRSCFAGFWLFLRVVLSRAPKGSVYDQLARSAPLFSTQRWTCGFPVMYALWRELRSVPLRILNRHERGLSYEGLDARRIGTECHQTSIEYKVRIQGIQNLRMRQPWATLWDELLYLEGLTDGLRRNTCTGKSKDQTAYISPVIETGNIMPPESVQQVPKHGR